jgi:general secretion pathway protein C
MEWQSPRFLWVTDLLAIVVGAALAGHSAAMLVGAALPLGAEPQPPLAGVVMPTSAVSPPVSDKSIDAIVGRNLFCSTCDDAQPAPRGEGHRRSLTLLAIMYAPPPSDPRWSLAIVRDDEAATTGPYGLGSRLGDATIVAIEGVRVVLDFGGGGRGLLELLERPKRAALEGCAATAEHWGDGVRQTGAHSYEVRRSALEEVLVGGAAGPFPRVVPQIRDGEPIGLKLFGIRPEGPFGAIGLRDGDLLLEVNGRSIASPDSALAAYASLRSANHVSLLLDRAGQRVRTDYVVR